MRKFRRYLSMIVTFPAAIMFVLVMFLVAIAGAVAGEGFNRTFRIITEEFLDALKLFKARIIASRKQ